ncbi:MAG: small basic protein [Planctomycetaceae bacterium]|nr:small basic protein [Planctomycetaceae bacterium]
MSIHSSFRSGGAAAKHRNVLSRLERLEKLEAAERWTDADGLFGMPKVRSIKVAMKKKKKKTDDDDKK